MITVLVAAAGPAEASDPSQYSFDRLQGRLSGQPCRFEGLIRGAAGLNRSGATCRQSAFGRMTPQRLPDRASPPDETPASLAEASIARAFKQRTFETLAPAATVSGADYAAAPAFRALIDLCRNLPPLPVIAKGSGLAGVAFDLRLDRLRIDVADTPVEIVARGAIDLFDLGNAGGPERLYAVQAESYAELPPSGDLTGWPERNTDSRRGDRGILHLVLLPSCRYAGGIVFASRATMETTYHMTVRYPGAGADGSDIVHTPGVTRSYMSVPEGMLARLIRIEDQLYFLTRWRKRVLRKVTIRSERSGALVQAVRAGDLGDQGWQRDDSLVRLAEAGLEFDVAEADSAEAVAEIWQIVRAGDEVRAVEWAPRPANTRARGKLVPPGN